MRARVCAALLGGLILAGPALAEDDYPLIDDLALTMGRVVRDGSTAEVNVSVKNGTNQRLSYIGVTCSALDASGEALDTAPANLKNVPAGVVAHDKAIFFDLPRGAHFECRVDSYNE